MAAGDEQHGLYNKDGKGKSQIIRRSQTIPAGFLHTRAQGQEPADAQLQRRGL